jgi:hypothetical protein
MEVGGGSVDHWRGCGHLITNGRRRPFFIEHLIDFSDGIPELHMIGVMTACGRGVEPSARLGLS